MRFRRTVTSFSSWLSLPSLPSSLSWPCYPPWSLKLAQCKSTFDMHSFRLHHDCKIDTASFKEGKRPPHPRSEEEATTGSLGISRARSDQSKATTRRAFAGRGLHHRYE